MADGSRREVTLGVDEPRVAKGGRGGTGELGVEERPERAEDLPELVVAHPPVDRDESADEVERLQRHVAAKALSLHRGRRRGSPPRERP